MVYCSVVTDRLYYSHQLTVSLSLFLPAILEMDSPTLLTSLMKPAPLMAAVSLALGSYTCMREREREKGEREVERDERST